MSEDQWEDAFDTTNKVPRDVTDTDERLSRPNLLEMDKKKAAQRMFREWNQAHKELKGLKAQWKVNALHTKGYIGVKVLKQQDDNIAHVPTGSRPSTGLNKAARLCRRIRNVIFADPAKPEATPSSDMEDDRDRAEFSTRVLEDECSEGKLDFNLTAGDAFQLGADYGSGFVRFWVDETGGGWQPKDIMALPYAETEDDPLTPQMDPETGLLMDGEPFLRYVREDGALTDDRDEAEKIWFPRLRDELLTSKHVQFIPSICRDLWEADGARIGAMVPLGTVKKVFPDLMKMKEEDLMELLDGKPDQHKELLAPSKRGKGESENIDEKTVFVLTEFHVGCAEYPKGAYLVALGEDHLEVQEEWYDEDEGRPLDIPLTQFAHVFEDDNPYSAGSMQFLGPAQEILATADGAKLEHLDKFKHRKTFLSMGGTLQPAQMQAQVDYLNILPGTEPKYEDLPDFPRVAEKMSLEIRDEMDDESGLQQGGQGVETPSVQSGKHAQTIVAQAHVNIADLIQNAERGLVRGWRIMLQLIRAYYTQPQRVKWVGEDGNYKEREWVGTDLGSTIDVRIQKGSFTQMTPVQKAMELERYAALGEFSPISPQEFKHLLVARVGGLTGLQDDPHRLRARRQVTEWQKGPPESWSPPVQDASGQMVDPNTGQPFNPLSGIFKVRAIDEDPSVAMVRAYELGRSIAGVKFTQWQPQWQAVLEAAYHHARQAAGIVTLAEQQQAAQAQAAQALQPDQIKQQMEGQRQQSETERANIKAGSELQKTEMQTEAEQAKTKIHAQTELMKVQAAQGFRGQQ